MKRSIHFFNIQFKILTEFSLSSTPPLPPTINFLETVLISRPIPVAARSKDWVCGRSVVGIAGSKPAEDVHVYLFKVLYVVTQISETGRSLIQRIPTEYGVSLCVI